MRGLRTRLTSFDRPARLLMANQFAINLGFYMLMPYLADHLAHGLGLAAWTVGLVLGVRNLSQQGMFLVGGTLADRYGCKPMILTGCALRTVAFALLAVADSLPVLIAASALTGWREPCSTRPYAPTWPSRRARSTGWKPSPRSTSSTRPASSSARSPDSPC